MRPKNGRYFSPSFNMQFYWAGLISQSDPVFNWRGFAITPSNCNYSRKQWSQPPSPILWSALSCTKLHYYQILGIFIKWFPEPFFIQFSCLLGLFWATKSIFCLIFFLKTSFLPKFLPIESMFKFHFYYELFLYGRPSSLLWNCDKGNYIAFLCIGYFIFEAFFLPCELNKLGQGFFL
jgi:hypothetical protein